ncbi:MAG: hypothetical protein FWH38_05180 [Treponema sp.]|nr:hypothetical protein [Treponema sp.]
MKILFNDVVQKSNAPAELKSPALSDPYVFIRDYQAPPPAACPLEFAFDEPSAVNCIGIGNCSEKTVSIEAEIAPEQLFSGGGAEPAPFAKTINGGDAGGQWTVIVCCQKTAVITVNYEEDGLYLLGRQHTCLSFTIALTAGAKIGRLAAGKAANIPTAVKKEPGFHSTAEPRRTLSGQAIAGAGGYFYRSLSLDSRYKTGPEEVKEIWAGYGAIGSGFPFFIDLSGESYKLPFSKLYATEKNQRQMGFESGARRFLYSRRWEFEEAF